MKALSFGEILWDVIGERKYIGGAPFNVAAHLAKMGAESAILSAVGDDELGRAALAAARGFNVGTQYVNVHKSYPTGVVDVKLDCKGVPAFTINENTAWDNILLSSEVMGRLQKGKWDVFCFGTLAQRTAGNRETLGKVLGNVPFRHVFYDVNLRQKYYEREWVEKSLRSATVAKVNDDEAAFLSEYLFGSKMPERDFSAKIAEKYDVETICVTRGGKGSAVFHKGEFREFDGVKVEVADTVGAGDAFSAAFLFAYVAGKDPFESAKFAGELGAYVASRNGAVPEYSDDILRLIQTVRES